MRFVKMRHPDVQDEIEVRESAVGEHANAGWQTVEELQASAVAADEMTAAQVLEQVGSDPAKARSALDAERAGKQRVTLLRDLERLSAEQPAGSA